MVRKIRAKLVLQLRAEGLSGRAIAGSRQCHANRSRRSSRPPTLRDLGGMMSKTESPRG